MGLMMGPTVSQEAAVRTNLLQEVPMVVMVKQVSEGQGGKGSGLDISSLAVINFVLTYGSGGYQQCGGVLINGQGPDHENGMGEGYGGGGEGCSYNSNSGSPGAVLIEIKQ